MSSGPTAYNELTSIDEFVAGANPLPSVGRFITADHRIALDSLRKGIAGQPFTARRRPAGRRLKATMFLLAAAMTIAGTTAAAEWVKVHTGVFGPPGMTESDTSEWLREDSPEILGLIDKFTVKYPLPPGGSWNRFKKPWPHQSAGYMQMTGLEGGVAVEAMCQWQGYWLAARQSGDTSAQFAALHVLDSSPDWPIIRRIDGGGFVDNCACGHGSRTLARSPSFCTSTS
jgi:hypothetical protein